MLMLLDNVLGVVAASVAIGEHTEAGTSRAAPVEHQAIQRNMVLAGANQQHHINIDIVGLKRHGPSARIVVWAPANPLGIARVRPKVSA